MMRRAFALVDLAAIVALVGAGGLFVAAAPMNPLSKSRQEARQLKDATQIRAIMQSMVIWSQQNKDQYPLCSPLDRNNDTVKQLGRAKDTTANIFSMLIWNGSISPELLISPLENNKKIKASESYQYSDPKAAVKPAMALWDPGLNADFTGDKVANNSYAHLQPAGGRMSHWSCTFSATEPVVCTRGPQIESVVVHDEESATPTFVNPRSNTFSFYTPAGKWSGNVAFNDCHVDFIGEFLSPGKKVETAAKYVGKDKKNLPDMAFFDEPDDPASVNNFLGIFTTAGEKPADFKSIWD